MDKIIPIQASCPELSLEEIVINHTIKDDNPLALKIDCEGCEYKTIEETPKDILQNFQHIMLEFHDGVRNLLMKFNQNGFKTELKMVKKMPTLVKLLVKKNTELGYVYAQQNIKFDNLN